MKEMKRYIYLLCLLLLSLTATASEDISARLQALPGISDVQPLESEAYQQKYVMYIDQQTDPRHPEAGTFRQRVILCHVGLDRPTVIVTEGYFAEYALRPAYQDELSRLFNANVICVEYRFFGKSYPEPCNWDYLTVENSLYDLHHVNQTFRRLYQGKWLATGISKGGQTTMFYRTFFPDDVDVSVPYVAPAEQESGRRAARAVHCQAGLNGCQPPACAGLPTGGAEAQGSADAAVQEALSGKGLHVPRAY